MKLSTLAQNHFKVPRRVGTLDRKGKFVGFGSVWSIDRQESIHIYLSIEETSKQFLDFRFKAASCWAMLAVGSYLGEQLLDSCLPIDENAIENYLINDLELPPHKWHCARMAVNALKIAVQEYQNKQNAKMLNS